MKFEDGSLYYIDFGNTFPGEINKMHLAILFNINGVDNAVLAIPLTSPKLKHFRSLEAYEKRNYLETKFLRLHYIKQTDSIALFEQLKSISKLRIKDSYKNADHKPVILNEKELFALKSKLIKYIKFILYK